MEIQTLPSFVFEQVDDRWKTWYPTNPLKKLIAYFRDKSSLCAINILKCEDIDLDEFKHKGSILNAWRYDKEGLQSIDYSYEEHEFLGEDNGMLIDYAYEESCLYSIDKEEKRVKILWSYFFVKFISGNLNLYKVATEYNLLFDENGKDNLVLCRRVESTPKVRYVIT